MMEPEIRTGQETTLVGRRLKMSLANDHTFDLWRSFMPERMKIPNKVSNELFAIRVYSEPFRIGDVSQEFQKWAAIEVTDFDNVPDTMEQFILPGGLYALFHYKGLNTDSSIFVYIFTEWLPNSNYVLDDRPHFEILGAKYKNADPESEEEIWIPVKLK